MRDVQANPWESGRIFINLIILLFFLVFSAVLYLARRPILRFTAESWIIEDPLDKADAAIVLGDDNFYADRATRERNCSGTGRHLRLSRAEDACGRVRGSRS